MSALAKGMAWFKAEFGQKIAARIAGTPYSLDMLTAIATQETYYIWSRLIGKMTTRQVLELCVGDTIDAPNRSAFPINKEALLQEPGGQQMFDISHDALVKMAAHIPEYAGSAAKSHKFCHGFGIFQYDLQHFKSNPNHFLTRGWFDFDRCLDLCLQELDAARKRAYGSGKTTLTDEEMVYVAIAYNRGSVDFSRKFKQGHKDDSGKYYGEYIDEYLKLAHTVSPAPPAPAQPGSPAPDLPAAGLF